MATETLEFSNGYRMPIVGFGSAQPAFFIPEMRNVPVVSHSETTFAGISEESDVVMVEQTLSTAMESGYRLIDTALWYRNERIVGDTLKRFIREGKLRREDVFITTKLYCIHLGERERVREGFHRSLEALQVDYVDLYLIHWPVALKLREDGTLLPMGADGRLEVEDVDLIQVWKALEELVDEGKIRSLGLSNCNSEQIDRIHQVARHPICNLQVECHVHFQQVALREFCKARGITVTSYGSLGSPEFLAVWGVPPEDQPLNDATVAEIARKHSKTSAQVLLRFLIQEGVAVIPKSYTPSRIKENMEVFDFTISAEDMARLRELGKGRKRLFHVTDWFGHAPTYPFHIAF